MMLVTGMAFPFYLVSYTETLSNIFDRIYAEMYNIIDKKDGMLLA